jgi:hypothetical protein
VLGREAAAIAGVLILLLNIAGGALSLSNFGTTRAALFAQEGKVAVCSLGGLLVLGTDGETPPGGPGEPQQGQHECTCCVLMQASTAMSPPAAAPEPDRLAVIHLLRPGSARPLEAEAVPAQRNRGPPSHA